MGGQRAIVVREPAPAAVIDEAPPEPRAVNARKPAAPFTGAIWVAGHWSYGSAGFVWVSGRYTARKAGHVFVPPRWAFVANQYYFFAGYFVPYGVLVRSHFNRFYFSGNPPSQAAGTASRDRGPYWPIGVSGRGTSISRSRGRGPYWPIGLRGSGPVGLRPSR